MAAPSNEVKLFNKPVNQFTVDEKTAVIDIYKTLIDMADKVSQRRQNANNFYLSVNTAIIGASAYLSTATANAPIGIAIISVAGLLASLLWKRNIDSYKDLNTGKFHVITELETALPIAAFSAEWAFLERGETPSRYRQFHTVEKFVPYIFAAVHLVQCVRIIPWTALS